MTVFKASGPVAGTIDLGGRGDVSITATSDTDVSVEIRPRNASRLFDRTAAEQAVVKFSDDRLRVRLKPWRRYSWFSDGGATVVSVKVPLGSVLEVASGMGDIRVDGEFGDLLLSTGMGEITVDVCANLHAKTGMGDVAVARAVGHVDIGTGSGTVRVDDIDGSAEIKNANGATFVGEVTGELRTKAPNGDIFVGRANGNLTATASNGAVRVASVSAGVTTVTNSGSIQIGVQRDTQAWLDLHSKYGQVRNELAEADPPASTSNSIQVRAHTSYGNVTVHPSRSDS